eukprot:GILK01003644.1.p1 GENE.GILK01003644.1~~GILK01003644.1.p1  ORF type:complete len:273 (-),score=46.91 GILK01003644.1:314-1132(-)
MESLLLSKITSYSVDFLKVNQVPAEEMPDEVILEYIAGAIFQSLESAAFVLSEDLVEDAKNHFASFVPSLYNTDCSDGVRRVLQQVCEANLDECARAAEGKQSGSHTVESTSLTTQEHTSESVNGASDPGELALREIFPDLLSSTILSMWQRSNKDINAAVEMLLEVRETHPSSSANKENRQNTSTNTSKVSNDVKKKILDKYMLHVDEGKDLRTHRPFIKTTGPPPKVRYFENQVVTTRGEKQVVLKEDEKEDMKHTYITLNVITKGKRGK